MKESKIKIFLTFRFGANFPIYTKICDQHSSNSDAKFNTSIKQRFLFVFQDILENLSDEEFQTNVESLRVGKLEKPTCLMNKNSEYWNEISIRLYDFKRMDREVEELNKCSKQDVIAFYRVSY